MAATAPEVRAVCSCCMATAGEDLRLERYTCNTGALKRLFFEYELILCYKCTRMATNAEQFIENVQQANAFLNNMAPFIDSKEWVREKINKAHFQLRALKNLQTTHTLTIDTTATVINEEHGDGYVVQSHRDSIVKQEGLVYADLSDDDNFGDINDFDVIHDLKTDQFDAELQDIKLELHIKDEDFKPPESARKKSKKKKVKAKKADKKKVKVVIKHELEEGENELTRTVETITLTAEEHASELARIASEKHYTNAPYKCERCVKAFSFKDTYESHLKKHSIESGNYECDVCAQRAPTEDNLRKHRLMHFRRYRCVECGIVRSCRNTVHEHHMAQHAKSVSFDCAHCAKSFLKRTQLKKHIHYKHVDKQRESCGICSRSFVNKDALRKHIQFKHVDKSPQRLEHECPACGRLFRSPSHLRAHQVKHIQTKEFYCVECDRHFKSAAIMKQHLKTAAPHVTSKSLTFSCENCDGRFCTRRQLERHVIKMHLHIKPYPCDRCDKAYSSKYHLTEHKRRVHEGYARPLRFPCSVCDKVFTLNKILKDHMRTHTGERPYQCPKCPAKFSQSGVLHTHNRLIHLKLQRNGKPKEGRFDTKFDET